MIPHPRNIADMLKFCAISITEIAQRALILAGDTYISTIVLYLILRLISGTWLQLWPVTLISTFLHWIILPSIPLLIVYLLFRQWGRGLQAGICTGAFIILFGGLLLPKNNNCTECADLTVMTLNTGADLYSPNELVMTLRGSGADIIGLQELTVAQAAALAMELQSEYPYQALYGAENQQRGILSRYPISRVEMIESEWEHLHSYVAAVIELNGQSVMVVSYRAHPPRFGRYMNRLGYHTWRGSETIADALPQDMPTILLADLNTTDQTTDYNFLLRAGFDDAFREGGQGYGSTFPARTDGWHRYPEFLPPLVRIDYIFVSNHFKVLSAWNGEPIGSDHLPVFARLTLMP